MYSARDREIVSRNRGSCLIHRSKSEGACASAGSSRAPRVRLCAAILVLVALCAIFPPRPARASTYVVMIPLDSPIYDELDTLNNLGYLDTYFPEERPIARVEAARLTREAERNMALSEDVDPLAEEMTRLLEDELEVELGWLRDNREDNPPALMASVQRVEAQYIYSSGTRRFWRGGTSGSGVTVNAVENTPLMDNTDGIPTAPGSNEVIRAGGWMGAGTFLTLYGEGAMAGPVTRQVDGQQRFIPISAESVVSLGNQAISFGMEEKRWGPGYFAPLSQGANAQTFPAVTWQNVHPKYLPWILKYLGPGRRQIFMGQLDPYRPWAQHPWIVGHILTFKPLPWFQFGTTRAIIFGGRNNDHYDLQGFFGRLTGFSTGNASVGNTNSRAGVFLRFNFQKLRGLQLYQEMVGEDNLTNEISGVGRFIPFLAVSYQGGFYIPRITLDGRTDLRFEYSILEPNYSLHAQGLYWVYQNQFMGDPLGPNASRVSLSMGRWLDLRSKVTGALFYTEQSPGLNANGYSPGFYPYHMIKGHSVGGSVDFVRLGEHTPGTADSITTLRGRFGFEYVSHMNFDPNASSLRLLFSLTATVDTRSLHWELLP